MPDPVVFEFVFQGGNCLRHGRKVLQDHMRRQGYLRGADGPDVQVVHVHHSGDLFHLFHNLVRVDFFRYGINAQPQALRQQLPGGNQDDKGNHDADNRVYPVPAGKADHDAGYHHAHGNQRIGQHVQVGTAHVDIVILLGNQQPGGESVHQDADAGGPADGARVDLDRTGIQQFLNAFNQDDAHGDQEDDGVQQGNEDGTLAIAIGKPFGRVACGKPDGHECQQQAEDVAQVVSGIGKEPQRAGSESHARLDQDKAQVEGHGQHQMPLLNVMMVVVMMMFVCVLAHKSVRIICLGPCTSKVIVAFSFCTSRVTGAPMSRGRFTSP